MRPLVVRPQLHGTRMRHLAPGDRISLRLASKEAGKQFLVGTSAVLKTAASQIIEYVRNASYDGVQIDFEGLPPEVAGGYKTFMKFLKIKFQSNLERNR